MTNLLTAALPATATVAPTPDLHLVPAGLTDLDTARITAAIAAARTESTRRLYALVWGQWERWCAARRIDALPADPLALPTSASAPTPARPRAPSTWLARSYGTSTAPAG